MPAQVIRSAAALWRRVQPLVNDDIRRILEPQGAYGLTARDQIPMRADLRPGNFARDLPLIRCIVVHATGGWPTRQYRSDMFRARYQDAGVAKRGLGPQTYIDHRGRIHLLLSENRITGHATYLNGASFGVETGNLLDEAVPTPQNLNGWTPLSNAAEDLPGAKLYFQLHREHNELLVATWKTNTRQASPDAEVGRNRMLFSEAQYRSWALLARYHAEAWSVPRHFPLRPHLRRDASSAQARWQDFRALADADPLRDNFIDVKLAPLGCDRARFDNLGANGFPRVYGAHIAQGRNHVNDVWTRFCQHYRGFIGHQFVGVHNNDDDDHNCPGPWFDWDRFARDVWDYWWFPFDLRQAIPADVLHLGPVRPVTVRRDRGAGDPILHEHYWDADPHRYYKLTTSGFFGVGSEAVSLGLEARYLGAPHGGMHFPLAEGAPIYSAASGKLVAACFPGDDADAVHAGSSRRFLLIRHEVFHQRREDRIDYDQEPTPVYSLYMHLGKPRGLSFTEVRAQNPEWLNALLRRKKECDLGLAYHQAHPPDARWNELVAEWRRDQAAIHQLIIGLESGDVVTFPDGDWPVSLGDCLGEAGPMHGGVGIHFEVFSDQLLPGFVTHDLGRSNTTLDLVASRRLTDLLTIHAGGPQAYRRLPDQDKAALFGNLALRFKSEWSLSSSDIWIGWDEIEPFTWWKEVAQLPADGYVWHYHPLGFMAWLNALTWRSEWRKFALAGNAPARPPSRR